MGKSIDAKKTMKRILSLSIAALFFSSAAVAKPVSANFGHGFPQGSIHHEAATEFAKEVSERSDGAINVHVFHSGQLGSAREMFEGLQLGSLEMTWVPTARISGFAPQLQLFDLPFVFKDMDFLEQVVDGDVGTKLLDSLAEQQVTGVGFYIDGFKAMTANKPLRTLEDFNGVKFRTMESEIVMSFYRSLGANPVPMDYAEVYNGLQMGTIDAQENPVVLIHDMKFQEVQKHLTISEHAALAGVLVYSTQWFKGLTDEQQAMLMDAGRKLVKRQRQLAQDVEKKDLDAIRNAGVTVYALSAEEKQPLREATKGIQSEYVKKNGDELLKQIEAQASK
ncbi:TRAP transporter substrate-binding protein [Pusillimonas sp. ANT_WB101]|uniref:TRAP transporter substrate-binding protein n=1 Tax=Pusillimonas sp. ANT_WB101 TaxID=2597356 RepID=UPI0011EDF7CA|nr:TRAP transporter substrate-binding protein [Pusillimonas sp. ANT_WB101]KAA0911310.1 TRAP transporter substrate-binding protein [Pusillimonas sp. ANT_WB101]